MIYPEISTFPPDRTSISPSELLTRAAREIRNASRVVLLIGNRIDPIPLVDFQTFVTKLAKDRGCDPDRVRDEALQLYWDLMETVRISSSNFFPCWNYFLIYWLIVNKDIRVIMTTNYDNYLQSTLTRTKTTWVLNPVLNTSSEWDRQGYYNYPATGAVQVWTLHGNLGFVRFKDCNHILKLPLFILNHPLAAPPGELSKEGFCSAHDLILKPDGEPYGDPSLTTVCGWSTMQHHTDFGKDRGLFFRETTAAFDSANEEFKKGAILIILGLTASPRYPEGEIEDWLSTKADSVPIVYINSSRGTMGMEDSNILKLLGLKKSTPNAYFLNEVYPSGASKFGIESTFIGLMEEVGADLKKIENEIEKWHRSRLWHTF